MLPQTQAQQRLLAQALRAAQPRPDVFAQAIARNPSVQYSTVLPLGVQTTPDPAGSMLADQRTVMAMPELVRGLLEGIAAPNLVRQGKMDPMTGAMLTAGVAPVGGLLFRAPAGSLGMNVFHGTPHRFAPEPDFPQGRPRMDKMGTGEGAQKYGKGIYTAEQAQASQTYKNPEGSYARLSGHLDPKTEFAFDMLEQGSGTTDVMSAMLSKYGGNISYDDAIRAIDNARTAGAGTGNLYKLDIPDADAAKLLDYDAPISQQPKVVQDAITKLGFMPDNPDKAAGGDVWFRMRQQLGEDEAAAAMREAGVPGLRYKDAGSRGTDSGDGTRNFVVWDQDVLNRTKVLQRNDETFFSNAKPAAAAGGLLNAAAKELPMDEASRMARAREMGFDTERVVYHGTSSDGFNAFDDAKIGSANDAGFYGRGHYFATTPGEARYFGPNVQAHLTRGRYLDLSNETGDYTARGHFKSFAPKLDKIGALDDAQKAALADIKKAEKYVADNVEYSVGVGADGTEGVYAKVKTPAPDFDYDITIRPDYRGNFSKTREEALQRLQDTFMSEMESHHPELYPNISMDNWSVSLSDYVRADSNIGAQGLTKAAKRGGYDGIIYGDETVVFDPKNIRRADAAFDPAKSDSADLLSANPASAALPGLLMGGPSMTQQQMRDLLADPSGA